QPADSATPTHAETLCSALSGERSSESPHVLFCPWRPCGSTGQQDKAAPEHTFRSGPFRAMRANAPQLALPPSLAVRQVPPFAGARDTQIKQYPPCLLAADAPMSITTEPRLSMQRRTSDGHSFLQHEKPKQPIHNQPSDPSLASGTHGL
ncbi:hypothetical protein BU25DRAFT_467344, partial [Macroventuria anomochaeta]